MKLPMISDVVALPMYDRVFIMMSSIYCMGVHQVNVRAFYKRMHGVISLNSNYVLFYAGITSCFTLPMIGVFDCYSHKFLHYLFAFLFFVSAGSYSTTLSWLMYHNRNRFPVADHPTISLSKHLAIIMFSLVVLFILSQGILGSAYWTTPILEWSTVFLHMNYFSLINFTNPFFDSIHPYGHLV